MNKNGMVYLVGAGPGDPELLTLKGEARLKECEVVIYDRLASDSLIDMVPGDCEKIYVGKVVGNTTLNQEAINQIIVKKALEGKRVVRLKGGDPFVFGRGGEEVLALQKADIPYQVIPGITSAIAAATYAGIPITHRGISRSFHVITGHTMESENQLTDNYEALAKLEGTLVFLMGMGNLSLIIKELCKYGKDINTPVAIVSNGTTGKQKTVKGTLLSIEDKVYEHNIKAPAVIIIGGVAAFDMKATVGGRLSGKRIGVTGTEKLTDKLSVQLRQYGASVENLSFLQVREYKDNAELKKAITNLKDYTWIVFTSTNGVDIFFKKLKENNIDYRNLSGISFAVVGKGTKDALLQYGFIADYIPEIYTTAALAEGLAVLLKEEDNILIPRALKGSKDLTDILSKHSIPFHDVKIYSVEADEEKYNRVISELADFDYITFVSASGVEGFFENPVKNLDISLNSSKIVCIGDITAKRLEDYGIVDYIIAREFSVPGMVESILEDAGNL
ncbi:MAG: uroporphyrinogen-III C-methyltransferase [Anaerocolumna sp.]